MEQVDLVERLARYRLEIKSKAEQSLRAIYKDIPEFKPETWKTFRDEGRHLADREDAKILDHLHTLEPNLLKYLDELEIFLETS